MADKKKSKKTKDKESELVLEVQENLSRADDAESDNRKAHIEDTKFENGEQWEETAKRDRENHGRPAFVFNKTAGTSKRIIGGIRQNNVAIKVRPVDNRADPQTAEILSGLIRNIENVSDAKSAYDCAAAGAVRGNIGYFRIITDYSHDDTFDQDIFIKRIVNPLSVYLDPSAVEANRSDAKWCVITQTMDREQFKVDYPGKSTSLDIESGRGEKYTDWFTEDSVKIAEYFKVSHEDKNLMLLEDGRTVIESEIDDDPELAGIAASELREQGLVVKERTVKQRKIMWYKVSGAEILEQSEWAGKYIPIIPVLGEELWIEGKLHLRSALKWAKAPAMSYNWARSNMIETLALAPKQPTDITPEQIEGHEEQWDQSHNKPQPYRLYNHVDGQPPPKRNIPSIQDSGSMVEAQIASDDIKAVTGIYDASLGARSNETSGVAIRAREAQGENATYEFTDNLQSAIGYAGKILVDLIPKVYDTERVVRLLNRDGSEGWAKINQQDPMDGSGKSLNDITIGKYDVVTSAGPAYATQRMEVAEGMFQVMQSAPNLAPILMPDVVKMLDWPNALETAQKIEAATKPKAPPPPSPEDQLKVQGQQITNQGKQLDNKKKLMEVQEAKMETEEMMSSVVIKTIKQLGLIPDEK